MSVNYTPTPFTFRLVFKILYGQHSEPPRRAHSIDFELIGPDEIYMITRDDKRGQVYGSNVSVDAVEILKRILELNLAG